MIGQTLDNRYTVTSALGRGSMGHVYAATDSVENREVAVKVLEVSTSKHSHELQVRFKREAKTLISLSHPNVVRCFALGELEKTGQPYLVMELADGRPLSDYLRERHFVPFPVALEVISQVGQALAYIHQRGIVHRDIKPANMMLMQNGQISVKLLDFGLAHLADDEFSTEQALIGTFPYMSPEQTGISRQPVDGRSDLYALGVTFYRLITGELPFKGETVNQLIHQHVAKLPMPPSQLRADVSPDVERIILRLLAKDVTARYQTADGLVVDIQRLKEGKAGFELSTDTRTSEQVFNTTAFVGRVQEFARLNALLDAVSAGTGQVVLLTAPQGSGKSRLMDELRREVLSRDGVFLTGQCDVTQRHVPFLPLKRAITAYISQRKHGGSELAMGVLRPLGLKYGGILTSVIPELRSILPEIGPPPLPSLPSRTQKQLFLTALVELFLSVATHEMATVLLLEDAEGIDLGTLQFLEAVGARLLKSRWLVALTANEKSRHPRRLKRFVQNLHHTRIPLLEIELKPFNLEEMKIFVELKLGEAPNKLNALAQLVHQRARGNCFEAGAYVETLVTEGVLSRDAGKWVIDHEKFDALRYSTEVVNTVVRRLALMDRPRYRLLSLASVNGNDFSFDLLRQISGDSEDDVLDAVDEAMRLRLITQDGNELTYSFRHPKIRNALYDRLDKRIAASTHRRIAEILEARGASGESVSVYPLADHYDLAREPDKALNYLVRAGNEALAEYSVRAARDYFIRAKKYLEDPRSQRQIYIEIEERLGDANNHLGRHEEALLAYEHVLSQTGADATQRRVQRKVGMLHHQAGDSPLAVQFLEESLRASGISIPRSAMMRVLSIIRGILLWSIYTFRDLFRKKRPVAEPADQQLELIRIYETLSFSTFFYDQLRCYDYHMRHHNAVARLGREGTDVNLAFTHAVGWLDVGFHRHSVMIYLGGVRLLKRLSDPMERSRAMKFQSAYLWSMGKVRDAVLVMRRAVSMAEKVGDTHDLYENLSFLGHQSLDRGDYRAAINAFERLVQSSYARDQMIGSLGQAIAHAALGQKEAAFQRLAHGADAAERCTQPGSEPLMRYTEGHLCHLSGDLEKARRSLEKAYDVNQTEHLPHQLEVRGYCYLLELYLTLLEATPHDRDLRLRFRRVLRRTRIVNRNFRCYRAWIALLSAEFHRLIGASRRATLQVRSCMRSLRTSGMRHLYARSLRLYSRLLYPFEGEPLGEAMRLFQQMGLNTDVEQISGLLNMRRRRDDTWNSTHGSSDVVVQGYLTHRRELDSLLEINQAISAVLDYDELLQKVLDSVIRFVGAERGFLMTFGEDGKNLEVKVARNIDHQTIEGEAFRVSRNIINRVIETEKATLISDAETDPDFKTAESVLRYNLRSILCIPLKHSKTVLGVLYLENNLIRNLFTEEDVNLLSVLATQATISLQNAKLFKLATTDSLTGVYLRRFMENRLKEEFERSQRYGNPLSIVMLDVDHFKAINDTHGHPVGDKVLVRVAEILKSNLRDTDLVARYGGEEFCLILKETDMERAREVAERIRETIAAGDSSDVPGVTASFGIATVPDGPITHPRALIEAADVALYRAKAGGRNRVELAISAPVSEPNAGPRSDNAGSSPDQHSR